MFSIGMPKKMQLDSSDTKIEMQRGIFVNQLNVSGGTNGQLLFSRRYSDHLDPLADLIHVAKANGKTDEVQFDLKTT